MTPAPVLRPYQRDQLGAISTALYKGTNRVLVKSPTGTGKTVTFAAILKWPAIEAWLAHFPPTQRGMLVIAHREELLDQAARKIHAQNPHLVVCVEQADRYAVPGADVVVASIQTLASRKFARLRRLMTRTTFRVVVVDEAHHAAAATYRTALAHLGFLPMEDASDEENIEAARFDDVEKMGAALLEWDKRAPKDRVLLGVTATPNRSDAIGLGCVFQSIAYAYNLKDAIDDGWLVPITPWAIDTRDDLDDVRVSHGEFNQKDLAAKVNNRPRNDLAVAAWTEHAYDRQTIAFTVDVAHAHDLAQAFCDAGVRAAALSGETPKEQRHELLRRFSTGDLRLLANCQVLTEGTDLPTASCILHAKPTKSATLYEQMTGRGLRTHPDDPVGPARKAYTGRLRKEDCVVIDLVDVTRRHSLQAAPILYGLPPGLKVTGVPLDEAEAELAELLKAHPSLNVEQELAARGTLTLEQLRARAELVDIWQVPDLGAFGQGRSLRWMKFGEAYRVEYPWEAGNETLVVSPDLLGQWQVVCTYSEKPAAGNLRAFTHQTLAAGIQTPEAAATVAEAYVQQHRQSAGRMKAVDAPWRSRPATPKQLARLSQWRIPHNPKGLTAGQASDFIDLFIARRQGRRQ